MTDDRLVNAWITIYDIEQKISRKRKDDRATLKECRRIISRLRDERLIEVRKQEAATVTSNGGLDAEHILSCNPYIPNKSLCQEE